MYAIQFASIIPFQPLQHYSRLVRNSSKILLPLSARTTRKRNENIKRDLIHPSNSLLMDDDALHELGTNGTLQNDHHQHHHHHHHSRSASVREKQEKDSVLPNVQTGHAQEYAIADAPVSPVKAYNQNISKPRPCSYVGTKCEIESLAPKACGVAMEHNCRAGWWWWWWWEAWWKNYVYSIKSRPRVISVNGSKECHRTHKHTHTHTAHGHDTGIRLFRSCLMLW